VIKGRSAAKQIRMKKIGKRVVNDMQMNGMITITKRQGGVRGGGKRRGGSDNGNGGKSGLQNVSDA